MKKIIKWNFTILTIALLLSGCNEKPNLVSTSTHFIPSLDQVSGKWISSDTMAIEPSIRNFRGQALLNRDMTSISWFVSAPYSGGHHTGTLKINGKTPKASHFRWQPYQAMRKGNQDELDIKSYTRMLVEKDAILWKVEITNTQDVIQNVDVDLDMIGFISKYDNGRWNWWYPYPEWSGKRTESREQIIEDMRTNIGESDGTKENISAWPSDNEILKSDQYKSTIQNNTIYIHDKNTPSISAFTLVSNPDSINALNCGGKAEWRFDIAPGETKVIKYLMTYGDNISELKSNIKDWKYNFDESFASVKTEWEKKWIQLFTPHNTLFSGSFPVLESEDDIVKKVYYTGPLTLLYLLHTNLPEHERVFLTGGPRWGASITFFWDIAIWSELWAVVDPAMMKEQIIEWIKIDPNKFYGKDNYSGKGVGNGYSANYWCLYKIIRDYVVISGDYKFLDAIINNKTVLNHIEDYALNWKNLSIHGDPGCEDQAYQLADFGDNPVNLLECVPTYKHIVPSFNIGYMWMMRETAKFYQKKGNNEKSDSLTQQSEKMMQNVLKLYAGNGVWNSLYPNNKKVEVRHVLDFIYFGKYMANEVSPEIKQEMIDFFNRELKTDSWMRAQSLSDISAEHSDRPDHGPLGSFDGWIPEVMDAISNMGYPQDALDFYRAIEPVTNEGCWAQAHELWGKNKLNKSARVRIASRGWNNRESSSGIGISQVMLKNFFGFNPQIGGNILYNQKYWPFSNNNKLHHVFYNNKYYSIEFENNKPIMVEETIE